MSKPTIGQFLSKDPEILHLYRWGWRMAVAIGLGAVLTVSILHATGNAHPTPRQVDHVNAAVTPILMFLSMLTYKGWRLALLKKLRNRRVLVHPPLRFLDWVCLFLWSSKTYERVFLPARMDILTDWQNAEVRGHRKLAWWIRNIRGPGIMLQHMAAQVPWSMLRRIVKALKLQ